MVGVGKEAEERETLNEKGEAKKENRKKYTSRERRLVGTATSTRNAREVEEVVGILDGHGCRYGY